MKITWFILWLTIIAVLIGCATATGESEAASAASGESTAETTDSDGVAPSSPESRPKSEPAAEPAVAVVTSEPEEVGGETSGLRGSSGATDESSDLGFMTEEDVSTGASREARSTSTSRSTPQASGLSAGFADDNRQYGYFVDFLEEFGSFAPHEVLPVEERIMISIVDSDGKSVSNADVQLYRSAQLLVGGRTGADGTYQFNPSEFGRRATEYAAEISTREFSKRLTIQRYGARTVTVQMDRPRNVPEPIEMDILFILDTTGSMGEEIHRLRTTIELIHLNLTSLSSRPDVRFGMVLYKDRGDEYITNVVPLTADLVAFQEALDLVKAGGGGDTPEDLQAALDDTIHYIDWNTDGIRLCFIITDAPPHLDYAQTYTYADAARDARAMGIKLHSVGTGGLDLAGEYVLRQLSQYTGGKYIFLTYGESGESAGGTPGSVSHHTGSNYQTDKLEAIIIRFAKEELSYLTDEPIEEAEPYFQAQKIDYERREDTLDKLFGLAIDQLIDYSTIVVGSDTHVAVLPLEPATEEIALDAEYFAERLIMAATGNSRITLVERRDIQKIIDELKFQLSGLTTGENVAEIGEILNAEILIGGSLYHAGQYELFLKMLRVETGEILSVTKAEIDSALGLSAPASQ